MCILPCGATAREVRCGLPRRGMRVGLARGCSAGWLSPGRGPGGGSRGIDMDVGEGESQQRWKLWRSIVFAGQRRISRAQGVCSCLWRNDRRCALGSGDCPPLPRYPQPVPGSVALGHRPSTWPGRVIRGGLEGSKWFWERDSGRLRTHLGSMLKRGGRLEMPLSEAFRGATAARGGSGTRDQVSTRFATARGAVTVSVRSRRARGAVPRGAGQVSTRSVTTSQARSWSLLDHR